MATVTIIPRAYALQAVWAQSSIAMDDYTNSQGAVIWLRMVQEAGTPTFSLQLLLALGVSQQLVPM